MLKKAVVVAGAAAGLMALAPFANADSADNEGANLVNDNNITVLPVQACDTEVIADLVPVGSPHNAECVNSPTVDHPSNEG